MSGAHHDRAVAVLLCAALVASLVPIVVYASAPTGPVDVILSDGNVVVDDEGMALGPLMDTCSTTPYSLRAFQGGSTTETMPTAETLSCIQFYVEADAQTKVTFAIPVEDVETVVTAEIRDGPPTATGAGGLCTGALIAKVTVPGGPSLHDTSRVPICAQATIHGEASDTTFAVGQTTDGTVAHITIPSPQDTGAVPVLSDEGDGLAVDVAMYKRAADNWFEIGNDGYQLVLQRDCGPLEPAFEGGGIDCAGGADLGDPAQNTLIKDITGPTVTFTSADLDVLFADDHDVTAIHLWVQGNGLVGSDFSTPTSAMFAAVPQDQRPSVAAIADVIDAEWNPVLLVRATVPEAPVNRGDGFYAEFDLATGHVQISGEQSPVAPDAYVLQPVDGEFTIAARPFVRGTGDWSALPSTSSVRLTIERDCFLITDLFSNLPPGSAPCQDDVLVDVPMAYDADLGFFLTTITPEDLPSDFWIMDTLTVGKLAVHSLVGATQMHADYNAATDQFFLEAVTTDQDPTENGATQFASLLDGAADEAFTPIVFVANVGGLPPIEDPTPELPEAGDGTVARIQLPLTLDLPDDVPLPPISAGMAPLAIDAGEGFSVAVTLFTDDGTGFDVVENAAGYSVYLQRDCGPLEPAAEGAEIDCAGEEDSGNAENTVIASIVGGIATFTSESLAPLFTETAPLPIAPVHVWVAGPGLDQSNFATPTAALLGLGAEAAGPVDRLDETLWHPVLLLGQPGDLEPGIGAPSVPVAKVTATDATGSEQGADPVEFTIEVSEDATLPVEVAYTLHGCFGAVCNVIRDGTALVHPDEPALVPFTRPNDDLFEPTAETIRLTLQPSEPQAGPIGVEPDELGPDGPGDEFLVSRLYTVAPAPDDKAEGTITDSARATVTLAITSPVAGQVYEDGAINAVLRLTRTDVNKQTALPVSIQYATGTGRATPGTDYVASPSSTTTLTIPAGATFVDLTLNPTADATNEEDETIQITLLANVNRYIADLPQVRTVTILDDDDENTPGVSLQLATGSPTAVTEGGDVPAQFTILRGVPDGSARPALPVNLAVDPVTGQADDLEIVTCSGLVAIAGAVIVPSGQDSTTVCVLAADDALVEEAETRGIKIVPGTGYTVTTPQPATVTVHDDEAPLVSLVASDNAAGPSDDQEGEFTVSRLGSDAQATTVQFTRTGTASATEFDLFVAATKITGSTFVIPASTSDAPLEIRVVPIEGPADAAPSETVILTLVDQSALYDLGTPSAATVTLYDDALHLDSVAPLFGSTAGGTPVTLRGNGFTAASKVFFGSPCNDPCATRSQDVDHVSDSELVATAPAHAAGVVNVIVRVGADDSNQASFSYVLPPTISSLSPDSGRAAGGTLVEIRGANFGVAEPSVLVDGVEALVTSHTSTLVKVEMPSHAGGEVPVTLTTAQGLSITKDDAYKYDAPRTGGNQNGGNQNGGNNGGADSNDDEDPVDDEPVDDDVDPTPEDDTDTDPEPEDDTEEDPVPESHAFLQDVTATPIGQSVQIKWSVVASPDALSHVEYGVAQPLAGKTSDRVGSGNFQETLGDLSPGLTFQYRVVAKNAQGVTDEVTGTFKVSEAVGGAQSTRLSGNDGPILEGERIDLEYALPAGVTNPRVQVLDGKGDIIAEVPLVQDPANGLWEASLEAPEKGEYKIRVAYSASDSRAVTTTSENLTTQSSSVGGAIANNAAPIALATVGVGSLGGVGWWVLRRTFGG